MARRFVTLLVTLVVTLLCGVGVTAISNAGATTQKVKHGGTLTVLETSTGVWSSLDPANDVESGENTYFMSALYGQLFALGPNNTIVPQMASGYKFLNHNMTVDIFIRKGIKFSDGTTYNAQAVAASINRDIAPTSICPCAAQFSQVKTVRAVGPYTVQIQLKQLDSPIINDFIDVAPNWTVDPTALAKEGEQQYGQHPVGAGPFEVKSQATSAYIDMVRNPHYFIAGKPYLAGLNFLVTSSDQSALAAVQSGQAQVAPINTTSVFQQAQGIPSITTYRFAATAPEFVRLNTLYPPFNNLTARQAVSYATNASAIIKQLYGNLYAPIHGYLTPAQFFFASKVPGYLGYNLSKAKQLVSQIPGGLSVVLDTTNNTPTSITETEAIAAQWNAAGIKTTVSVQTGASSIALREHHSGWQAMDGGFLCGPDPSSCTAINLASNGLFTGLDDPTLDGILNQASLYVDPATRARVYEEMDLHLNKEAELVWLYAKNGLLITTRAVQGIPRNVGEPTGLEDFDSIWLK